MRRAWMDQLRGAASPAVGLLHAQLVVAGLTGEAPAVLRSVNAMVYADRLLVALDMAAPGCWRRSWSQSRWPSAAGWSPPGAAPGGATRSSVAVNRMAATHGRHPQHGG